MQRNDAEHKGKLPKSAGLEITLRLPGETPSPFCDALRAWIVVEPPKGIPMKYSGYKVCEHQVDLPRGQVMKEVTGRYLLRVLGWIMAGALYVRWLVWRVW